jgi:hypothetical protein
MPNPSAYPPNDPSLAITRWHGTMMGIGFAPFALPTARTAVGAPIDAACCAYDMVEP